MNCLVSLTQNAQKEDGRIVWALGRWTACGAAQSPEHTESSGMEMGAETVTLLERTEDLQPAQEQTGWVMTAV